MHLFQLQWLYLELFIIDGITWRVRFLSLCLQKSWRSNERNREKGRERNEDARRRMYMKNVDWRVEENTRRTGGERLCCEGRRSNGWEGGGGNGKCQILSSEDDDEWTSENGYEGFFIVETYEQAASTGIKITDYVSWSRGIFVKRWIFHIWTSWLYQRTYYGHFRV